MSARLHVINKPPEHPRFQRCMDAIADGDGLVLREAAVLALLQAEALPGTMFVAVHAIERDMDALGIKTDPGLSFQVVDYETFIDLVCDYESPIYW